MSWKSLGQCLEYAHGEIRFPVSLPVVRGVIWSPPLMGGVD